jgi:hypothetical protein
MAEQSKFAGALGKLNKRPPEQPVEIQSEFPSELPAAADLPSTVRKAASSRKVAVADVGRGGKRSNPEFSPTTFFVRKETKRKAARLLEDTNAGKDLSDLVEELLTTWVSKRSHV